MDLFHHLYCHKMSIPIHFTFLILWGKGTKDLWIYSLENPHNDTIRDLL